MKADWSNCTIDHQLQTLGLNWWLNCSTGPREEYTAGLFH